MQGQAQAAAAAGMALRYVGSLDLVNRTCSVTLKVTATRKGGCCFVSLWQKRKHQHNNVPYSLLAATSCEAC